MRIQNPTIKFSERGMETTNKYEKMFNLSRHQRHQTNNASKTSSRRESVTEKTDFNVRENPRKENSVHSVGDVDEFSHYGNQYGGHKQATDTIRPQLYLSYVMEPSP